MRILTAATLLTVTMAAAAPTGAEPMKDGERQRLLAHLEMTESWLTSEVEGLSDAQLKFRMDEAERVAQRIAIIDHGAIVAEGSAAALKEQTSTGTLEEAFLALTGTTIREEQGSGLDQMRNMAKMWSGRR